MMNIKWIKGNAYIWFSRAEFPPKGKLVSMKKIIGEAVTTQSTAEQVLRTCKKANLREKLIALECADRISIDALTEEYVSGARADLDYNTLRMDRAVLKYLEQVSGKSTVRLITHDDLIHFKNYYLAQGRSPETVKAYFRHLKAAFSFAAKKGHIKQVPEFPQVKAPRKQPRPISPSDLNAILEYAKEHHPEIWRYAQFSVWTGCRQEECIRLKHQWIIRYDQPTEFGVVGRARVIGKRDRERTVFLLPAAMEAIGKQKDVGPVFHPYTGWTVSRYFKQCVRGAGLEKPHFHDLRHTAATRMVSSRIPIEIVQKILGHTDIRVTQIYAEIVDKVVEDQMGKMGKFL